MRLVHRRDIYLLPVAAAIVAALLLFRDPIHSGFANLAVDLLGMAASNPDEEFILSYMAAGPAVGDPALEMEGYDLDGNLIRLADQRGKVVFLYFYAHW
jgi:hypothetical protein